MITSYSNPLVKRIKRLRQKKNRERENAYYIEGLRVVLSAVEAGAPIDIIVFSQKLLNSDVAWQMLTEERAASIRCEELSEAVFRSISQRDNPVGLGAIVNTKWTAIDELPIHPEAIFVALVQVGEPGNLGSVLRTMDATGATGLILVGAGVDPFHSTAVKASMGTLYSVPIARAADEKTLMDWSRAHSLQVTATTAKGATLFWQAQYRRPGIVIMGSERTGLPNHILAEADQTVSIPMAGSASSLNLAVATGVILYELARQHRES